MKIDSRILARLVALALVLLFASSAAAQFDKLKGTTPEQRAKVLTEVMKLKLGLSPAEEEKIAALNLKYAQRMQPVIDGGEGVFKEMREIRDINGEKEAELKKTLSPDQFTKYMASKDEIKEKFEEKLAAGK